MSVASGTEGAAAAAASSSPTTEPAPASTSPAATGRPEFIPDKFWDPAAGAPKVEDLAKSYGELEKRLGAKQEALRAEVEAELRTTIEAERTKARPAEPSAYELKVSDGILPEGVQLEWRNDDPLVAW